MAKYKTIYELNTNKNKLESKIKKLKESLVKESGTPRRNIQFEINNLKETVEKINAEINDIRIARKENKTNEIDSKLLEEKRELNKKLITLTIANTSDSTFNIKDKEEIEKRLAEIDRQIFQTNTRVTEYFVVSEGKMNFGGYSPKSMDKEQKVPISDSAETKTDEIIDTEVKPKTTSSENNIPTQKSTEIKKNPIMSERPKSVPIFEFPPNPNESVGEKKKRLEKEKKEKDLLYKTYQESKNNTSIFEDISTIYSNDQDELSSKKRRSEFNSENLFEDNKRSNLGGTIPKRPVVSHPTLKKIEEDMEMGATQFGSYVPTPKRAFSSTKISNRKINVEDCPNEGELNTQGQRNIYPDNPYFCQDEDPERNVLKQKYHDERKVTFKNPNSVSFDLHQQENESRDAYLNILNRNIPQNSERLYNSNTREVEIDDNSNVSRYYFNPNFQRENQHMSMRGIDQPRKSFLKRLYDIPKFNGESHQNLTDFIDTCETLYCSIGNEAEEREFFEQMMLRLRGEAKKIVNHIDSLTWKSVKQALRHHFSYLFNKDILTSQIENLRQERDENLTKYAERARKLLMEKNSVYNYLTEEQKAEHNRIARKSFAKGILNNRLRDRLITRGSNTLEDAISYAIETENDILNDYSRNDLFCGICRMVGHRERDCRSNNAKNNDIGRLISALRSVGFQSGPSFNRFDRMGGFDNQNSNRFNGFGNNGFGMRRNFSNFGGFARNNANNNRNWNFNRNNNGNWFGNGNNNNNWNRNNANNWNRNNNWNREGNNDNRFDTSNVNNNRNRDNQFDQNKNRQNQRQDFQNRNTQFSNNVASKDEAKTISIVEQRKEN